MSRLGEKIHSVRIQKGMTVKDLARKLGVAEKFVIEVEEGRRILNDALVDRISKVFGHNIDDDMLYQVEDSTEKLPRKKDIDDIRKEAAQRLKEQQEPKTQLIWNDALESVLKNVPVYDYELNDILDVRPLPVISNRIEGYAKDKVVFIEIQDSDMIGFRMTKGDIALGHTTHEIENNTICLVEYNEQRKIRQIKKLDSDHLLLVSNRGSLVTETVSVKNIKVLVKLDKLEIKL
ncbi:MAG: helix-turn-helix domain-containing protein [Clostridia bacterium]